MILIIGGAYQGKFEYAKANFKEGHQIINNFHKYVRKTMQQGGDPELEAKQLMNKAVLAGNADKLVLVSDEVGSGIVPRELLSGKPGGAGHPRDGGHWNTD